MEHRDLRWWIRVLEEQGDLCRIRAEVDWNLEISEILRRGLNERRPAMLFENIKDHRNGWCTRLFANGLGTKERLAQMFGLPRTSSYRQIGERLRQCLREPIAPVVVEQGPVKENVRRGDAIDLTEVPAPLWHELDGGRYISTWAATITRDPDTGELNAGAYRGMLHGPRRIGCLIEATRDIARHFAKYRARGISMPVAVVYGWDPAMVFCAGHPFAGEEYGVMGAIRRQAVELIRCETSDLLVPASAEIVVEGTISPDPATYLREGPFGEFSGVYGGFPAPRPVIEVDCVTHRDDPIFRGNIESPGPGAPNETSICAYLGWNAALWQVLEAAGHADSVLDAVAAPWSIIKIRKSYEGQARHIAAALWGSKLITYTGKIVVVVEDDVDIHNLREVQVAIWQNADPAHDFVTYPLMAGGSGDPALSEAAADFMTYGSGLQTRLLIDATVSWPSHPARKEWGGRRKPPVAYRSPPQIVESVARRWAELGIPEGPPPPGR